MYVCMYVFVYIYIYETPRIPEYSPRTDSTCVTPKPYTLKLKAQALPKPCNPQPQTPQAPNDELETSKPYTLNRKVRTLNF